MKKSNINAITEKEMLVQNDAIKMICFVFEQAKGLPNHTHNGMAVIQVVSGQVAMRFADGKAEVLKEGDVLEFDARIEHNVLADVTSKVIVTMM